MAQNHNFLSRRYKNVTIVVKARDKIPAISAIVTRSRKIYENEHDNDKAEKRFSERDTCNPDDKSCELGNAATLESHAWVNQFNVKTCGATGPRRRVSRPPLVPREHYTRHADALRAHSTSIHRAPRRSTKEASGMARIVKYAPLF